MRLKELREDNDLKQINIAQILNCKQNTYYQYESGKRQIPISALKKLAEFCNTSIDYIVGLINVEHPATKNKKHIS